MFYTILQKIISVNCFFHILRYFFSHDAFLKRPLHTEAVPYTNLSHFSKKLSPAGYLTEKTYLIQSFTGPRPYSARHPYAPAQAPSSLLHSQEQPG